MKTAQLQMASIERSSLAANVNCCQQGDALIQAD
jgi:hypothetical protein